MIWRTWIPEINKKKRLAYLENSSYRNLGKKVNAVYFAVNTRLWRNFCWSFSSVLLRWMMRSPPSPAAPEAAFDFPNNPLMVSLILKLFLFWVTWGCDVARCRDIVSGFDGADACCCCCCLLRPAIGLLFVSNCRLSSSSWSITESS